MFESNFPPDKGQCSYQVIFNAFKRLAAQYSEAEKTALFSKTATDFYRLEARLMSAIDALFRGLRPCVVAAQLALRPDRRLLPSWLRVSGRNGKIV